MPDADPRLFKSITKMTQQLNSAFHIMDSKEALSGKGNGDRLNDEIEDHPPPPYQETSSSSSSSRRPSVRTLRAQFDEGKSPKWLRVFEMTNPGEGQQPLYTAKLHITSLLSGGAHMEFKIAPHDEKIGSVKFHKTGGGKVDLQFRNGKKSTMTGYTGVTYSIMNFTCPSAGTEGRRLQWKRPGQGLQLICLDPNGKDENKQLASMQFETLGNPVGNIVIEDDELGRNGHCVEEMVISGLSYVHLLKYMQSYAGGRSSIGVGV